MELESKKLGRLENAVTGMKETLGKVSGGVRELLRRKKEKEVVEEMEEKKKGKLFKILVICGIVIGICAIAYAIYKYFTPDYLEDYDDDYDDRFDDEFLEDEVDDEEKDKEEADPVAAK